MTIKIDQLFDQVYKVPVIPEIVRTLIIQLSDPNFNMDEIAKNVEKEQVISLKVLRIVNSAYFGLPNKISSIHDAVVLLGMAQLKTLVIASGLVECVPEIRNFDVKTFWLNSFRTATYAKWLAQEVGLDADTAFTAGLISGLGTVMIYLGAPGEANEIEQHINAGNTRYSIEERRLGFTSQDVCAELCRRWKFPEDLVVTIEQSGKPLGFEEVKQLSCLVYIARYISECKDFDLHEEDIMRTFPRGIMQHLEISEQQLQDKLPELLALESGLEGLIA